MEIGAPLVAGAEPFELVQPGERTLDDPAHLAQSGTVGRGSQSKSNSASVYTRITMMETQTLKFSGSLTRRTTDFGELTQATDVECGLTRANALHGCRATLSSIRSSGRNYLIASALLS